MITPPAAIQALLFASGEPLKKKQLEELLGIKSAELKIALEALADFLKNSGLSVIETKDEVELRTSPEAATLVKKLYESELSRDLGKASMETLAVIAYQPVPGATRSEIDWVRGVNSSASLRILLMRGLINKNEDERDKRRMRYTLTTEALAHLGLSRIEDLPRFKELSSVTNEVVTEQKEE